MAITKEILLDSFDSFISRLSKQDRIAVMYHTDADGMCSAASVVKALHLLGFDPALVFHQKPSQIIITNSTIEKLKKNKINKLITLDLCVDQLPERVKGVEKFAHVLILDHHKRYHDLNSEKTLMVKSQAISNLDGSAYPASKLAFDLFSRVADLDDIDWIACVGLLGDVALTHWEEFVDKTLAKHQLSVADLDYFAEMISAVETLDVKKLDGVLNEFLAVEEPYDLRFSKFSAYIPKLDRELNELCEQALKAAENYKEIELVFIKVKNPHDIKSALINRLSRDNFIDKTLVVVLDSGREQLRFSARRPDFKIAVNDLLETAVKGIPEASAGGHKPAAAGRINREHLAQFKKNLISELKNIYKKNKPARN